MYLYAYAYLGLIALDGLCQLAFHWDDKTTQPVFWGVSVVIALQGNYWYKRHVETRIAQLQNPVELARRGGTSFGAAVLFTIALAVTAVAFSLPQIIGKS